MNRSEQTHMLRSSALLLGVYIVARNTGWIGPNAHRPILPEVFWPAVYLVTAWGVYRLLRRSRHGNNTR